jgi:CHAT domain-containing protein/tetratricopeptide (TPR) repeat protein
VSGRPGETRAHAAGGIVVQWRRTVKSAERAWAAGQIAETIRLYQDAVPGAEREADPVALGQLLHNLGLALDQAGHGARARAVLLRARDLLASAPEGAGYLGNVLRQLGSVEAELGELDAAVACHEEALAHARARSDAEGAARAEVDLGLALKDAGRLTEALAHLGAGLARARACGLDAVVAHALTGLGLAEEKLERRAEARARYLAALPLYRKLSDQDNEATLLYNLSSLDDAEGDYAAAARWLGQALALDQERGNLRGAADSQAALASLEIAQGHPEQAQALLLAALASYRSGGYRRRMINSLIDLAAIARDDHRFDSATGYLAEALGLAAELADPLEIHDVQLHWGDLCYVAGDNREACAHYAAAAAAMGQARQLLMREQDALSYFGQDRVDCIDRLIVLTALDDPRACVEWVERAKGQELIRRLAGVPLPPPRGAPESAIRAQELAADELRTLSARLDEAEPASPDLLAAYLSAQRQFQSAASALAGADPEWSALRAGDAPGWPDVQALLARLAGDAGRGAVLVHYYLREDTAAVIGLRPGAEPDLVSVAMSLAELRGAVAEPGQPGWSRTLELLARLVAPISAWAAPGDRVVLCPHDTLHRFPLHAASVAGQPVGERFVVSYSPSAAVLRYCLAKRRDPAGTAVILADASAARPLPVARGQATALSALFRQHEMRVTCAVGAAATLDTLTGALQRAPGPRFVHFAVHGFTDPATGFNSGIELADGPLTARQLLGLRLDCQLACLAACDTGVSERRPGDELLGLIRSAVYAGAPSVLASLWPVDQLSSAILLQHFYQQLLAGLSQSDALHAAQLRLRQITVTGALGHLTEARQHPAVDPHLAVAFDLAEASLRLFAQDLPGALAAVQRVLSRERLSDAETSRAAALRELARIGELHPRQPDYSRSPFSDAAHWAPFVLIGDPG